MKKGSAAAKAWGRKMKALRNKGSNVKKAKRKAKTTRRVSVMAKKRKYSRRSSNGFSMGKLTSTKNLIGTIGGAIVGQKMGIDPRLAAAAGSYIYGKGGLAGAGVGYFAAPTITQMTNGLLVKTGTSVFTTGY